MNTIELNDVTFDSEVKRSTQQYWWIFMLHGVVLAGSNFLLWMKWQKTILVRQRIGKMNVDDGKIKAAEFGISSIPALLVFQDGQVVEKTCRIAFKKSAFPNNRKILIGGNMATEITKIVNMFKALAL